MAAKPRTEARSAHALDHRAALIERFQTTRSATQALCASLVPEDYVVQSMADVSPTKWHLAHTSWFFEQFVLARFLPAYRAFHPGYGYLFNSYYEGVGARHPRAKRGLLSRPTVEETYAYRAHVDDAMQAFMAQAPEASFGDAAVLIELGLNHEEQHQELILTDIKHVFGCNPLRPVFANQEQREPKAAGPLTMVGQPGGIVGIGHGGDGFAFDNETPRHRVLLNAYRLADRPVTNGDYLEFIMADGYRRPELWLSDGWEAVRARGWTAPLYWEQLSSGWAEFTLSGLLPLDPDAPVCHVSYYEADAYARFRGKRLPTEAEWEAATFALPISGNFVETRAFHPRPAANPIGMRQVYGDVWEWMASAYLPYPGFKPGEGAVGEYNGKFMSNQFVLRGGSCATPARHMRPTYRNFFPPDARWQFSGIRLAEDA
ncbi:MAG: ergothioneine biosynthesis protein EgtB [Alphaproteobacteria bacterium]|nr:ergothioneine biosynthesis protein EgtB [Alphaproteobacteria bacterium]